jgi:GT2 family glycosyltransferase
MSPSSLGISIATRNRWRDVEKTLSMVAGRPDLAGCPVILIDDGSESPAPRELIERHPNVEFITSEGKRGASEQRTRIARLLKTEFVLQLDDDSYPVEGSVREAVSFLEHRPDIVALALNIVSCDEVSPPIDRSDAPYPVEVFIGCGVLYRRELFLELGGFSRELGYYCEEFHFCASAAREDKAVYMFPSLVVRHEKSPSARSFGKIAYYQGRNRVLLVLWYYPISAVPLRIATSLPGTLVLVRPREYPVAIAGFLMGLFDGVRMLGKRRPLTPQQYRSWRLLPSCFLPRNAVPLH